ncbi:MAG TPA: hypothetical protein VJ870_17310 [Amycolatopsis sp.]|nr:hypothetical protein [Amycolatopsis sp.]
MEPVYITGSRAGEVEELQATVGQGPGIDALLSGVPTLVDDLTSSASARRWPLFTREAVRLGVHAMYSIPLALGAIRVGYLELYREYSAELTQEQLIDALVYADTALLLVLDARAGIAMSPGNGAAETSKPTLWHAEVHQAAGMVSVQLGIPVVDALVRLRAYAYSHDMRLTDVARAVVERRLRLHPGDAGPATRHAREGEA